jgi:magnesium-transporting ATPase (P-type)
MSIIVKHNGFAHVFIKGASEIILDSCKEWFNGVTGQVETLNE